MITIHYSDRSISGQYRIATIAGTRYLEVRRGADYHRHPEPIPDWADSVYAAAGFFHL